jgi:hypothetical protein
MATVTRARKYIGTVEGVQTMQITRTGEEWHVPDDCSGPEGDQDGARALAAMFRGITPNDGQEHLSVLALDAHGAPLAVGTVSTGTVDSCPLYPRDVFAFALAIPRVRFVGLAHNHPSGVVLPSGPDITGTSVVAKAGALIGIDVVFSMVITHESKDWALVPRKGERKPPQGDDAEPKAPQEPDEDEGEPEPEGEPEEDESPEGDEGDNPNGEREDGPEDEPEGEEDAPGEDEDELSGFEPEGEREPDDPHSPDDSRGTLGKGTTATVDELKAKVAQVFKVGR